MDSDYKAFTNIEVTADAPAVVSDAAADLKLGNTELGQKEKTASSASSAQGTAGEQSRNPSDEVGTVVQGTFSLPGTGDLPRRSRNFRNSRRGTGANNSSSENNSTPVKSAKRSTFRTHTSRIDEPFVEPKEKKVEEPTEEVVKKSLTGDAADGIEILIKLAAAGEFDPSNVDIIDVTDKFLRAIAAAPKENLRQSGKILFHASVLLRMKAEALLAAVVQDVDPQDDFLDFDENGSGLIYDSRKEIVGRQITLDDLERALVRKTHTRQNRQRKVTLEQLIEALKQAEKIEKTRAEKKPARAVIELAGQHEARDVDDLLDLAHDEDIEDTIERIERMLVDYTTSGDMINLLALIKMLDGNGDWVDAFLAVLFLSNAGKIVLQQEEFYGPLYVVRADEPLPQTSSLA